MAIKQFTGHIGDLVVFTREQGSENNANTALTLVGYVWRSEPTQVVLSNVGVMRDDGEPRNRSFFGDRLVHERTYSVDLESVDGYNILKPYVAPQ